MVAPVTVLVATAVGVGIGRGPVFLALAGGVLLTVIWVFWESLQSLTGDAPLTLDEAMGLGAPSAEEERKRSVLRTLKDLEYERSVGKISAEDYQELVTKYRLEAKTLLQLIDENLGPARDRAEQLLAHRRAKTGVQNTTQPTEATEKQGDQK
jgi:uncharacterized membrane protein YhiD involved in acid resistance